MKLKDSLRELIIGGKKNQQRSIPLSRVGFSDIYSGIQEKGDEPIEDMSNGIEPWVSGVLRQQIT